MKLTVGQVAKVCHEANRAYCAGIGDSSQPAWEDAPEWQRGSAEQGVRTLLKYPGMTPRDLHSEWMQAKLADGWQYGPVKDADLREHPCMVPYDRLPPEQRTKDELFAAIVVALMNVVVL